MEDKKIKITYNRFCFSDSYKINDVPIEESKDKDLLVSKISELCKEDDSILKEIIYQVLLNSDKITEIKSEYETCSQCGDFNEEIEFEI